MTDRRRLRRDFVADQRRFKVGAHPFQVGTQRQLVTEVIGEIEAETELAIDLETRSAGGIVGRILVDGAIDILVPVRPACALAMEGMTSTAIARRALRIVCSRNLE